MEAIIEPGSVFYFYCDNIHTPENKFIILLSCKPILWFFINSEIAPFIQGSQGQLDLQIDLIRFPYHMFLKYDSHIDCSEVIFFEDITYADLIEMAKDPNCFVGKIHQSVIEDIIARLENPITISPYHQKIIIKSLS